VAAPIQTLTLDTHYSIWRHMVAPRLATGIGAGATQVRRMYQRPVYRFTIKDSHAVKSAAEALYGFAQYHQGDIAFYWSGNAWGTIANKILFGFGDGTRTQFFLNNRHITTGTLQAYTDGVLANPQPTIDLPSGLLTFSTAVADQVKLEATYNCRYKVVFELDSETLMHEEMFYAQLYKYEGITLREVVP